MRTQTLLAAARATAVSPCIVQAAVSIFEWLSYAASIRINSRRSICLFHKFVRICKPAKTASITVSYKVPRMLLVATCLS